MPSDGLYNCVCKSHFTGMLFVFIVLRRKQDITKKKKKIALLFYQVKEWRNSFINGSRSIYIKGVTNYIIICKGKKNCIIIKAWSCNQTVTYSTNNYEWLIVRRSQQMTKQGMTAKSWQRVTHQCLIIEHKSHSASLIRKDKSKKLSYMENNKNKSHPNARKIQISDDNKFLYIATQRCILKKFWN